MRFLLWLRDVLALVFTSYLTVACGSTANTQANSGGHGASAGGASGTGGAGGTGPDCEVAPERNAAIQKLSQISTHKAYAGDVVVNRDGDAMALWFEQPEFGNTGEPQAMAFSLFRPEVGWGAREVVATATDDHLWGTLGWPFTRGRVIAVMKRGTPLDSAIEATIRSEDGEWLPISTVANPIAVVHALEAVVDRAGNAMAIWSEETTVDERSYSLHAASLPHGSDTWSPAIDLTANIGATFISGPDLEVLADDTIVALWSGGPANFETWTTRYDPTTQKWLPSERLSEDGEYGIDLSSLDNEALAVWAEAYTSNEYGVFTARFRDAAWSAPRPLDPLAVKPADTAGALGPRGEALALWQVDDGGERLKYAFYDPTVDVWSPAEYLEYPNVTRPENPSLTWVPCRNAFLVVWNQYGESGLHKAWYSPGEGWSQVTRLEPPSRVHAVDPWGNALFAWYDEAQKSILGQFVMLSP